MTSNRLYLNSSVQFLLGGLLVLFLAYCFHFNLELGDEGFYLYYFQQGHKAVTFNFYHVFVSPIGALFSHYLIGYRYLSLIFLVGSSLFLYRSLPVDKSKKTWLIPLSLGLMYFNLIATFSYNTLVLAGAVTVLSLLIRIKDSAFKKMIAFSIGLLCFFIFSARFGSGVIILILSMISYFLLIQSKKEMMKLLVLTLFTFSFCLGIYISFFSESFQRMLEVLPAISQSSHIGLFGKYVTHTIRFISRSFLPPLVLGLLSLRFLKPKYKYVLLVYLSWFIAKNVFLEFNFTKFWYYISGLILAMSVIEIFQRIKSKTLNREVAFFILIPLSFYFSSSLGTNNNLFDSATYNCLLLYPLIWVLEFDADRFQKINFIIFWFCLLGIYNNQYFQTYRSLPRTQQTFTSSQFSFLKGIKIDQRIEDKLSHLSHGLDKNGFNRVEDRIVTYPNLPGLVSILGLKSFGNPWNIDIYTNSHIYNCIFYKIEPLHYQGRLYLYAEKVLPLELASCLGTPDVILNSNKP